MNVVQVNLPEYLNIGKGNVVKIMRLIDADALKELFCAVIGGIAKEPEMTGSLEHMIRASAMVIQMIDDAPTIDPSIGKDAE